MEAERDRVVEAAVNSSGLEWDKFRKRAEWEIRGVCDRSRRESLRNLLDRYQSSLNELRFAVESLRAVETRALITETG